MRSVIVSVCLLSFGCATAPTDSGGDGTSDFVDVDGDGVSAPFDCNDEDATIHPGAEEIFYDGVLQGCTGVDDDQDGDGALLADDCDDTVASVHPGAPEVPDDGVDQDCDGVDLIGPVVDGDGDGFQTDVDCNDADGSIHPAAVEVWYDGIDQDCDGNDDDRDLDGYATSGDCDDADPAVHPGAGEVPGDGVDQNCDGADAPADFVDVDGDGYSAPVDCDDTASDVHPGAVEIVADGVDQNCSGADQPYADLDHDGWTSNLDCADSNAAVHPGAAEIWYDGVDQDCDGRDDDRDQDGFGHADDCDDQDALVFPGQTEIAGDGVDQDCDGVDPKSVGQLHVGDLVIDEVMASPVAVPDAYGEWFEVFNASGAAVDLEGLVVSGAVNGLSFTVVGSLPVAAGDVVVFGRERTRSANGGVDVDYEYRSDFSLDAVAESISLSNGSVVIDDVGYDTLAFFPAQAGASMSLDARFRSATQNDEGQFWCGATSAMSSADFGTPGLPNDACTGMNDGDHDGWVSRWDCADANAAIHPLAAEIARDHVDQDCDGADFDATALVAGELVISEIMYNPFAVTDANGEWFEVYNPTNYTINLRGMIASDDSAYLDFWTVDTDLIAAPQSYHVFAVDGNATRNGGVTGAFDYPGTSFNLNNSADDVYLLRRNGGGLTLIDSVIWDELAGWPAGTGASIQLRPASLTSTANDAPANWCLPVAHIANDPANDLGTPGRPNGC